MSYGTSPYWRFFATKDLTRKFMGTGTKIVTSLVREIERSQKVAARERARQEREYIRREKQRERERIRNEKEEARLQKQIEREQLRADKERLKMAFEQEKIEFEDRKNERRNIRLEFLNRM
jgi:chromatin assembly factor 1 subunit A